MSQRTSPAFQPSTFLERGASVPFTTPMLAGARVRPADRLGLEVIVPNPAGGRGDYIVPWTSLRSLCRPTVHDAMLTNRIAALHSVSPASIRRAACDVAAEGLAGRAAGAAATSAKAAEESGRVVTNFHLLLRLVQQAEPAGGIAPPPAEVSPAQLELRARRTIASLAPKLRQNTETIASTLEELAAMYNPIGLGARMTRARHPHALAMLAMLRREISCLPVDGDEALEEMVQMVVRTADTTVSLATATLREARETAVDIVKLLINWQVAPKAIGHQLARPDWLLDGWERICRLWSMAGSDADRRNALEEIVPLLPIIAKEAGEWVGFHVEFERAPRTRRLVCRHEDWRTGCCVQDTIARNEALLSA